MVYWLLAQKYQDSLLVKLCYAECHKYLQYKIAIATNYFLKCSIYNNNNSKHDSHVAQQNIVSLH